MEESNNTTKKESEKQKLSTSSAFGRYSGMAFQIGGAIILGIIVGWWLDKQLDCKSHAFTALFSILGVFVGLYAVIKDVLKK